MQAILDTLENENNRRQFSSFPAETVTQDVSADQRVKTEAGFTATPIHRLYNDAETGPNTALKQSHSPQFKVLIILIVCISICKVIRGIEYNCNHISIRSKTRWS